MSALLVVSFLLACAVGGRAAWRVPPERTAALAVILLSLCTSGVAGALSVAAEAGSAAARYLGLLAVLLASVALSGAFIAARRTDRARRNKGQP